MATLADLYLADRGGSVTEFHEGLSQGQRLGQAFFNALSGVDQERLRGRYPEDPFHFDGAFAETRIHIAIQYLLDTEESC